VKKRRNYNNIGSMHPAFGPLAYVLIGLVLDISAAGLPAAEIHDAAAAGDLVKVKGLLEANPGLIESKDNIGQTPLHIACTNQKVEIANFLIDKGADINARNIYGVPVLNYAINDGDECVPLVQRLLEEGAEVNVRNSDGGTPLHAVARTDNFKVARLLIEHGADLHSPGRHGTPLQSNIILWPFPHEEMAIFLVENGARPKDYCFGNNDLHLAALRGYADLVQAMIIHGADINAVNDYGHTALYYAARHGYRRAADTLIAGGSDKSTIGETNYGKAPQLTETLKEGEAYLWHLGGMAPGTGYAVKTKNNLLIFDPFKIEKSPEAGLANGKLNPDELAGQKVTILLTRKEHGPFGLTFRELAKQLPDADFVLSFEPTADNEGDSDIPPYRLARANESFSVDNLKVHTIQTRSSTVRSTGNLGYLVEADGVKVLHAGLLRSENKAPQIERFRKKVDFLKPFGPIDFVILPIKGHHLDYFDYEPYLYLIDQLEPKAVYLIGDNLVYEEHRNCLEVLKARDVPVFYPEGGIAMGERFHYVRD
jgi:ankyrin repeat protein/L-ascorbate metabolism protein UlaG (beta-lactamase superfamily)